ncbi:MULTISPECIES: DUF2460 domain-containing protein [Alphaproteobacteria]|uniref:Glycoside hydrolase family 24 n=2 Tax=Alphaproteobacteria TaxID=28211 RepID=A0A512HFZ9_9HYPH|nr:MULTISPECIES: DUF2460 domain-containing protein [Alphaproteobacteria]GEO84385.1 glycoside hydrolase family 24 [Ciceribacter naphthalenivorans]GLR22348.1 glycoside hydrolase family 24 [Ciceribacter naphthalenivorans]GLT05204.1 glycoside hydrolase family 24 [Sphingomonas psychrolutea]
MSSGFHEVRFPLRLSLSTSGGPTRRTDIVDLTNGREARNARWRNSRRVYDAGSGLRSLADLYAVVAFFEARGGQLHGFRFRDPLDGTSGEPGEAVTPFDQTIGMGDGETARFTLVKTYGDAGGEWRREIVKPVAGTVRLAVDGVELPETGFTCDATTGIITFGGEYIPSVGALVQAGFAFDVPVRFDTDRIDVNVEAFKAGRIPAIPLTEILP